MDEKSADSQPIAAASPRLLDLVRDAIRRRRYSYRTEETYLHWIKRFIYFSGKRSVAPRTGVIRRHHVYENFLIRGVRSPLESPTPPLPGAS